MANQEIFDKLRDAIVNQNVAGTAQLCKEALAAGVPALDIITKGLSVGMKIVGDKFEAAEIFLPQIMKPLRKSCLVHCTAQLSAQNCE